MNELKETIENAWQNRALLKESKTITCINTIIEKIDKGELRAAEPEKKGWKVNDSVKKAVILYLPIRKMVSIEVGPFHYHDKMKLKEGYNELGVRVVPHAIARYGAH